MRISPGVWRLLRLLVLAYLGVTVAALLFEEKLIYFPYRKIELTPADLGLRFEEARFVSEDGVRLHGWWLPAEGGRFAALVCHGNAGNISHRLDRALLMQSKLHTGVFLFDYRGYGRSEGSPDEQGTYRDGRAAYRYMTDHLRVAPDGIILFGESLGAAVAVQLALEFPARALILESPFTSIPDMARSHYPFLPVGRWLRNRYDNVTKIPDVRVPVLILHGTRDRLVPFEQGQQLFQASPEPKHFFAIPGAGHNDTFLTGGAPYWEAWKAFLASLED
ncbi:MAG: alpha/beta hydrolase [Acidobacteriota bacterium]